MVLGRGVRIAAPFVVAAVIAAGAGLPSLEASGQPHLPTVSPATIIKDVLSEQVRDLSGTISFQSDLGLPSLSSLNLSDGPSTSPSASSGFDPTSLLSGSHSFRFWIDGPNLDRISAAGSFSESDIVRRGDQVWTWNSATGTVNETTLPSQVLPLNRSVGTASPANPIAVAQKILQAIDRTTTSVTVGPSEYVAGRAAYVLDLAPGRAVAANRDSTVRDISIAVDAKSGLPLQVTLNAVGQSKPALQLGFTSISYATPSASIFAIPKGRRVVTNTPTLHQSVRISRHGTSTTYGYSFPANQTPAGYTGYAPLTAGSKPAGPAAVLRRLRALRPSAHPMPASKLSVGVANRATFQAPNLPAPSMLSGGLLAGLLTGAHPTTTGQDWGTVVVVTGSGLISAGPVASLTKPVPGGLLFHSALLNALIEPNGTVLAGFVTPAALESLAARH